MNCDTDRGEEAAPRNLEPDSDVVVTQQESNAKVPPPQVEPARQSGSDENKKRPAETQNTTSKEIEERDKRQKRPHFIPLRPGKQL